MYILESAHRVFEAFEAIGILEVDYLRRCKSEVSYYMFGLKQFSKVQHARSTESLIQKKRIVKIVSQVYILYEKDQ